MLAIHRIQRFAPKTYHFVAHHSAPAPTHI
jgi:hypothetical protein